MARTLSAIAVILVLALLPGAALAGGAEIAGEVRSTVRAALPWDGPEEVEVTEVDLSGYEGEDYDDVVVNLPRRMSRVGKVTVSVELLRGGSVVKTFWSSARISIYREVVVALRTLRTGEKISPGDVKVSREEMTRARRAVTSVDEAEGMVVKRPITAGSVVKEGYLRMEEVIKRGERVDLVVESETLKIRSRGIASEDGGLGSTVTVKVVSGKEVSGRVTAPGEVTIGF